MKPWHTLGAAPASEEYGVVLQERDGVYVIRIDGRELMSSRRHRSEEAMARAGLEGLSAHRPTVLIGGLGLGFTLRATLDRLPANASVVVAEVSPSVVEWNRGILAKLASAPLEDPRATVEVGDIRRLLETGSPRFHAILLDVDNGPSDLCRKANHRLYEQGGLAAFRRALHPGGSLVIWAAGPERGFIDELRRAGFEASERREPAHPGSRTHHTLFVGRLPG
jgi:spermidine synthase